MNESKPKSNYRLLRYPIKFKDKKTGLDKTIWKTCGRAFDYGEKVMIVIDAMPTTTNRLFFFKKEEPTKEELDTLDIKEERIVDTDFIDADQIDKEQKKLPAESEENEKRRD